MSITQPYHGTLEPLALMPPLPTHSISKIRKVNSSENVNRVGELETKPEKRTAVHYGQSEQGGYDGFVDGNTEIDLNNRESTFIDE